MSNIFAHRHLARYIEANMLHHIISRTFQGRMLLNPDEQGELRAISHGVMSRALALYPSVRLYNFAFLSNHAHWLVSAKKPREIPLFMRYVKLEISRRWGPKIGWSGALWETSGYRSTALPTDRSQAQCFRYILSQGVKEGLVASPTEWPGPHGAMYWLRGRRALVGTWFNGTKYSHAKSKAKQRDKPTPKKSDYIEDTELRLTVLPQWKGLQNNSLLQSCKRYAKSIIQDALTARDGKPFLGLKKVFDTEPQSRGVSLTLPWLERRATIVAWVSAKAPLAQDYLLRFWAFQKDFRRAANLMLQGIKKACFPEGAWLPGRYGSQ